MRKRSLRRKKLHSSYLGLACVFMFLAGCEIVTEAVRDGVQDFIESTTADLLEQALRPGVE